MKSGSSAALIFGIGVRDSICYAHHVRKVDNLVSQQSDHGEVLVL